MGAGTFKTRWREGFIRWERAWWCPAHKTYWYDDGVCRVCGARGEPEPVPKNAVPDDDQKK